jgi:hypothetical protein
MTIVLYLKYYYNSKKYQTFVIKKLKMIHSLNLKVEFGLQ